MSKNYAFVFLLLLAPIFLYFFFSLSGPVALTFQGTIEDSQQPNLAPSISVIAFNDQGQTTIRATARDDRGIQLVSVFADGAGVKSCPGNNQKEVICEHTGNFESGQHTYKSFATDGEKAVATPDQTFTI